MKNIISGFAVLASIALASSAFAVPAPTTKEMAIGISTEYIPAGFSSTTDAFVVINGWFPNRCYSWSHADVSNVSATVLEVRAIATVVQQKMCAMVMVPYQEEVNLGRLATGQHTLRFLNGDGTYTDRTLNVE